MTASDEQKSNASTSALVQSDLDHETSAPALPLVRTLFQRFNDTSIRYCHWKSNFGLPSAMLGETDLDLLVDPRDAQRFREILGRNGCKPVTSDPSRHFPGLEDWLGLDPDAGKLIHLHIHYRLVLGEQLVKNYTLPLERAFLDVTTLQHRIKVPVPELELIVLVLRALLKYRDRDLLRDLLAYGRSGIPPAILREIEYLRSHASDAQISAALQNEVAFITPDLVFDFLRTIETNPRAGWKLCGLRRRVRHELSPFQRHSRLRARAIYYRRSLARKAPFRRLILPFLPIVHKRKTPVSGGITVAVVGSDGAGKSTVIRELTKFFSWRLVTRKFYLGNAKNSLSRLGARVAGRVARRTRPSILRKAAEHAHELLLALQCLADARGRFRQYRAGRRAAAGGAVVIFDRFPLEAIQFDGHAMDGPRITSRQGGSGGSLILRWLSQRERRYYKKFHLPDLLIVLQVTPDIASTRKPDHAAEKIAAKCRAVSSIRRDGLPLLEIDASRPLNEVVNEVKSAVWQIL